MKGIALGQLIAGATPVELVVPGIIISSLDRYIQHRIPTGGFLQAVLENDLKEAVGRADEENQLLLPAIISYCYNHLPSGSWRSPEKVSAWLNGSSMEKINGN